MKILRYVALLLFVVIGCFAIPIALAFVGRQPIRDGVKIRGLLIVKDWIVSECLLPLADGDVALFDAGNDKTGKPILDALSRLGLGPENVKTIFLTHGHGDHIGGALRFPNAQVMALSEEVDVVEGRAPTGGPLLRMFPVRPTGVKVHRVLHDGEVVVLGTTRVQVFAVPGHTPGSAAYMANGVLILGDSADAAADGHVRSAPWMFSTDQAQNRASLTRLAERLATQGDVEAIVFAHSGVLNQGIGPLALAASSGFKRR